MPSEQDKTADRMNLVALAMAGVVIAVGFVLTISVALMWVGLPLMGVGLLWAVGVWASARVRAKADTPR